MYGADNSSKLVIQLQVPEGLCDSSVLRGDVLVSPSPRAAVDVVVVVRGIMRPVTCSCNALLDDGVGTVLRS